MGDTWVTHGGRHKLCHMVHTRDIYTYVYHAIHVCRTHFANIGGRSWARLSVHFSCCLPTRRRRRQRPFAFSQSKIFPGSQKLPPAIPGSAKILVGRGGFAIGKAGPFGTASAELKIQARHLPLPTPSEASCHVFRRVSMLGQATRSAPVPVRCADAAPSALLVRKARISNFQFVIRGFTKGETGFDQSEIGQTHRCSQHGFAMGVPTMEETDTKTS